MGLNKTEQQDILAAGENALAKAQSLIAKAKGGTDEDLEEDLQNLEAGKGEADQGEGEESRQDGDGDPDAEQGGEAEGGEQGEQGGDPDKEKELEAEAEAMAAAKQGQGQVAKAAEAELDDEAFQDATPILREINEKLTALDERLAKAAQVEERLGQVEQRLTEKLDSFLTIASAQQEGIETFGKAYQALMNLPARPKSQQRVVVPTGQDAPGGDLKELFRKADAIVTDAIQMGKVEHYFNRGDREGMLNELNPDQRRKVTGE
jgi:hypothetical protein